MKKQFLLSLIANGSRVVLGFVFFWQVSQALGLETLGEYIYVIAALGYFGTLIDYGFNLFVLNTASRSKDTVRPLFLRVVLSKLILTGAAFAILAALYGLAFSVQGAMVTALFFAVVILQSFSGLLIQFFKAMGRFEHELSSTMLASLLPVLLLFMIGVPVTLVVLGWIVVAVRLVVLMFQLAVFFRLTQGQDWRNVKHAAEQRLPRALADIRGNFKYAVFSVLGAVFLSVDVVIMRVILGPEDVSIYGTAMKAIMAVILFFEVLTGVFIPHLARQHQVSPTQFRADVRRFTVIMLAGASAVSLSLMALGPTAVTLAFGAEFAQAGHVLQVLSLVLIFRVMTMVSGSLLTVYGLQSFRARVMTIVLPIHLIMNLVLQPKFGIWGAVGTLATSFLLLFILNSLYLIRKKGAGQAPAHGAG